MCDFFFFLQAQKNKIQYEFSMWRSPKMREGPRVRMLLSRSCDFTCKLIFGTHDLKLKLILYTCIYINGGSHGNGCCRKRIRKWTS